VDIVVDTSAIISVITNEMSKKNLVDITRGCDLISSESIHWELGNALSAMIKRGRINLRQAKGCINAYQQIPIRLIQPDLIQTIELVNTLKIYAYDAYMLQCAREASSPLLTLDQGLMNAAHQVGVEILEF
jgi:predicted nucleic acid-binding protein